MSYLSNVLKSDTPQSEPLPGQVPNTGGGFAYEIDDWKRLDRFLILGTEGGTYYASERKLTIENIDTLKRLAKADPHRFIDQIVAVSEGGRAPKNDPALLALAVAATESDSWGRGYAMKMLPRVARIGTHLFHFADYANQLRGWGRRLRRGVAEWYETMPTEKLSRQLTKYRQRDGWSHRDLMRLAHPKTSDDVRKALFGYAVKGWPDVGKEEHPDPLLRHVWAVETAAKETDPKKLAALVRKYELVREELPTEALNAPEVWKALLEKMPMTAMVRNLGKLTAIGLVGPLSVGAKAIVAMLENREAIRTSRLHPIAILVAFRTYGQGHGEKGKLKWEPNQNVLKALERAFYLAFDNVPDTGKNWIIALDVSGSMSHGAIAGAPGLTPREGAAALALVTARTQKNTHLLAFSETLVGLSITGETSLREFVDHTAAMDFSATDCSLPMVWAAKQKVEADVFVVITDNETNTGRIHPSAALQKYRETMKRDAKLIVIAMTATNFSIADPKDAGMLDVVGFDTMVPTFMNDFAMQ